MITHERIRYLVSSTIGLFCLTLITVEPLAFCGSSSSLSNKWFEDAEDLSHPKKHAERIETFLKKEVPGLNATYRDVINAMIGEGLDVYIQGGMIRDLLVEKPLKPHDVDLFYTGNPQQMKKLLEKKKWMHTTLPGRYLISIGDPKGVFIDTTPTSFVSDEFGKYNGLNSLEYTLNNIVYHCNTATFLPISKDGLQDLKYRRLRVLTNNWDQWLDAKGDNYKKIFRFWKMVGKGFVYSKDFENFIVEKTYLAKQNDKENFDNRLIRYLAKDTESLDDITHGCAVVMGQKWCRDHILANRDQLKAYGDALNEMRSKYTYYAESDLKPDEKVKDTKPSTLKLAVRNMFLLFK